MLKDGAEDSFVFGTKGETLANLAGQLKGSILPDQVVFSVDRWRTNPESVAGKIKRRFGTDLLAVRSSAYGEDGSEDSKAGAHLSEINVPAEPHRITTAIENVIASYGATHQGDQVLVQAMVPEVAVAGVLFSRDLGDGGPYFVINYDDETGETDSVTGGRQGKSIFVRRARRWSLRSRRFRSLLDAIFEIEQVVGNAELDIEFCITKDETIYILQVRRLTVQRNWVHGSDAGLDSRLEVVRNSIEATQREVSPAIGSRTIFSEMSDWNPAEMIGSTPKPLALSLYRGLITDAVWSAARAAMGYRDLGETPLLVEFCGRPYIDVRKSLNSLLPARTDAGIARVIVDHQIETLEARPDLHDKIEFEVAASCRDLDFDRIRRRLAQDAGLSVTAINKFEIQLSDLTRALLRGGGRCLEAPLARTRALAATAVPVSGAYDLSAMLTACRASGTLPFATLARHGFIGVSLLRSLVSRGALSEERADNFLRSIRTVAADIVADMYRLSCGEVDSRSFLARYGHLRPGTYDIVSSRYDERPDLYLGSGAARQLEEVTFSLTKIEESEVATLLVDEDFEFQPAELFCYIERAIAAREEAKFHFTRCVSDLLAAVCVLGERASVGRDDLAYLHIDAVIAGPELGRWTERIAEAKEQFRFTRTIRLPQMITTTDDVDVIRFPLGKPTFITHESVIGPAIFLEPNEKRDIDGRILLIESADPGFDWIFSHPLKGLITMFGGSNSHMAIRCAEFGIPAAIGCGARRFEGLRAADLIELNCAEQILRVAS